MRLKVHRIMAVACSLAVQFRFAALSPLLQLPIATALVQSYVTTTTVMYATSNFILSTDFAEHKSEEILNS